MLEKETFNAGATRTHKTILLLGALLLSALLAAGCGKKNSADDKKQKESKASKDDSKDDSKGKEGKEDQAGQEDKGATGDQGGDEAREGAPREGDDTEDKTPTDPTARPGSIQAQMILIGWKGGAGDAKRTPAQAETLAKKVIAEAKKEKNFSKLVDKYSDGPKTNKGRTPPMTPEEAAPIFKPVFKLKVGDVTAPVKGSKGYYIFKRIK